MIHMSWKENVVYIIINTIDTKYNFHQRYWVSDT